MEGGRENRAICIMKKKFSTKWKASKQARKKRKYKANAPLHIKHKLMSANLSKELRKRYSRRSFPVRKGDNVKIMNGKFKKKTGKINDVDLTRMRVSIEGIQRQKKDGTKINVYFNASNLQIQELDIGDKERIKAISRGKKTEEKTEIKKENKEKKDAPEKK